MKKAHKTWNETALLHGKTVAITGATGGLGKELCKYILSLSGKLILLNRDAEKTEKFRNELLKLFPGASVSSLQVELTDIDSVQKVCDLLKEKPVDILVHNAGAYSIPRKTCTTGYDNVFQINFVSPYYMTRQLLPLLAQRGGKVVVVGSIAHNYSRTDPQDIDFAGRKKASLVYGNSKRYLMFAMSGLLKEYPSVKLAIAHPGITFTNITSHYPKAIFAIIKYPMKLIFMKPRYAARSILEGICTDIPPLHWAGPKFFNIWGNPSVKPLNTCKEQERKRIFSDAEAIYRKIADSDRNH